MILGTGTDIVEIQRLKNSIEKYEKTFLDHVFTKEEQETAKKKGEQRFTYFAGRWAAKEAISKALGTGFGDKCGWLDINVANDENGKPFATLSGSALTTANELGIKNIHISISHEHLFAVAMAIAEN